MLNIVIVRRKLKTFILLFLDESRFINEIDRAKLIISLVILCICFFFKFQESMFPKVVTLIIHDFSQTCKYLKRKQKNDYAQKKTTYDGIVI